MAIVDGKKKQEKKIRTPRVMKVHGFAGLHSLIEKTEKRINLYMKVPNSRPTVDKSGELRSLKESLSSVTNPLLRKLAEKRIALMEKNLSRSVEKRSHTNRRSEYERDERQGKELVNEVLKQVQSLKSTLAAMQAKNDSWVLNEWNGKRKTKKKTKERSQL